MASEKTSKSKLHGIATAYLVLYNLIQCIGWGVLLFTLIQHWRRKGTHVGIYAATSTLLNIFQTAAILEIVHAAVGLVKSNPVLTAFQVFSRVAVTWAVTYSVPEVQNLIGVPMFLVAWSVTEVIRYGFYSSSLVGEVPYILVWLRYTLFIVLYPLGVTGELLSVYKSLPYVEKSGIYSVPMPNPANISFNYYYFLHFFMLAYIPVFPQLYFHMIGQRKKIIGGQGRAKTD